MYERQKLLVGLGVSNMAVANYLEELEIDFKIYVDNPPAEHKFADKMFNDISIPTFFVYDEVIKSPGIPHTHDAIKVANKLNIPVTNEIGFTTRFFRGNLIAITGSNGKTTTTSLVTHLLNCAEQNAVAVGNIGHSFLESYLESEADVYVAELSSFQLKDLNNFNPDVSVILNLKSAHLDYHLTLEDYHNSKMNIFRNQDTSKLFVYNLDDEILAKAAIERGGNTRSFSCKDPNADCYFDGSQVYLNGQPLVSKTQIAIKGEHNIQNAMAAILTVADVVDIPNIVQGLLTFKGVEHRLEKLDTDSPIDIYNDSKSTNATAVKAALSSFDKPVVLLMGGLDRGNNFKDLDEYWHKASTVISFGESARKIYDDAKEHTNAIVANSLAEAIALGESYAMTNNQTLLFSPGCASWDQFKSYEERGKFFKSAFEA